MLQIDKITKSYKTDFWAKSFYALEDVSFQIENGQLVGFLGANGAGKTTLLKILMGFISPDKGDVVFDSSMGHTRKEIFSKIGFLPERPYFYPHLRGREFLQYMAGLHAITLSSKRVQIEDLAERLRISHALDRKIRGYSKGMLQRLGFLSVLLHDPEFIILDEPLSGLDPVGRKDFKDILLSLNKTGKTIFFSSHIVSDVEEICNTVVMLEKGKMVYQGRINELIRENINPKYFIKLENDIIPDTYKGYYKEELDVLEIPSEKKEEILASLVQSGCKISHLYQDKLTLEEVIYNLR